jgi:membrane-bound lytic murein transglycosylase D
MKLGAVLMAIQFGLLRKRRLEVSVTFSFLLGACTMFLSQNYLLRPGAGLGALAQDSIEQQAIDSLPLAESGVYKETAHPFWEPPATTQDSLSMNWFEGIHIEPEVAPQISNETPDQILSDFQHRINPDFQVPALLFNQTKFWFRVYTEFDSSKKIIHHSLHPHIVFDVVDVSDVLAQPTKARWLNTMKAEKMVSKRIAEVQQKLKKMARKDPKDMSEEELGWLEQLKEIKGNRKQILQTAAGSLRIQTGQKDFFMNGLSMSTRYLPGMEAIFQAKGLPVELTRLPFVESSFVIGATSKVGAAGIWQFMPGIGRKFMTVNDRIDERRNPFKATEAASKLLKENYTILHKDWGLALTAYNHGPEGVRKAMRAVGTRDIAKVVRSYRSKSFDFASSNFYTCFLAAMHAQMYHDLLFPDHRYEAAIEMDFVKLPRAVRAKEIMKVTGLDQDELLMYNPELDKVVRSNQFIPLGYRLFIPSAVKANFRTVVAEHDVKSSDPLPN